MNTSGEAADQVMRMMLNGAEVLVKLSDTHLSGEGSIFAYDPTRVKSSSVWISSERDTPWRM